MWSEISRPLAVSRAPDSRRFRWWTAASIRIGTRRRSVPRGALPRTVSRASSWRGRFLSIGGVTGRVVAKLSSTTGAADAGWNPSFSPAITRGTAIGVNGGFVYVGGQDENSGLNGDGRLSRVSLASGTLDGSWLPPGATIAPAQGSVYLSWDAEGNTFFTGSDVPVQKFLASTGAADPSWTVPTDTYFVFVDGSSVYSASPPPVTTSAVSAPTVLYKRSAATGAPGSWLDSDFHGCRVRF